MWRIASAFASEGWAVDAVDLRGHGSAPRTLDYTIPAFAADLAGLAPRSGGARDAVVVHSLGGVSSALASRERPGWARRLVLFDPAVGLSEVGCAFEVETQRAAFALAPHRGRLARAASALASAGRRDEDRRPGARQPVGDVGGDRPERPLGPQRGVRGRNGPDAGDRRRPAVRALYGPPLAAEISRRNPLISTTSIPGTGHSPHRDAPEHRMELILAAISAP